MKLTADMLNTPYYNKEDAKGDKNVKTYSEKVQEQFKLQVDRLEVFPIKKNKTMDEKIAAKINMGKKLTLSELNYIKNTNPEMYLRVKRIQMQRDMLEKRLKSCKSKAEVNTAYTMMLSSIGKKDLDREALMNAFQDVTKEFKKSSDYKKLPDDIDRHNCL